MKTEGRLAPAFVMVLLLTAACFIGPARATPSPTEKDGIPSKTASPVASPSPQGTDLNTRIFYKGKHELSVEGGWLPIDTPLLIWPPDIARWKLLERKYTLVPVTVSYDIHLNDIISPRSPRFLRGNTELLIGATYIAIPRGAESHYEGVTIGARYNFIQPNWKAVPYVEVRGGVGFTNAQGPKGVSSSLGQDLIFNLMLGAGLRFNFNAHVAATLGAKYIHLSSFYLSKAQNHGVDCVGPVLGITVKL